MVGRGPRRSGPDHPGVGAAPEPDGPAEAPLAPVRAFRQGLLGCLLNPKVGIFFVAVVPQFLPEGHSVLGATLLLGAVDPLIAGGRLLLVMVCAGRLPSLRHPRVHRTLERATGGVLIALGTGTAAGTVTG